MAKGAKVAGGSSSGQGGKGGGKGGGKSGKGRGGAKKPIPKSKIAPKKVPEPKRPEFDGWGQKLKNPLRWKRVLEDDTGWDKSWFREAYPVLVDDELFMNCFEKQAVAVKSMRDSSKAPVVEKEMIWASTAKSSSTQRRQNIAITMKAWSGKPGQDFLESLDKIDVALLRNTCKIRSKLNLLFETLDAMNKSKVEWEILATAEPIVLKEKYTWEENVEGFFHKLQKIYNFKLRMYVLRHTVMLEDMGSDLRDDVTNLEKDLKAALEARPLLLPFMHSVVELGNRVNANTDNLGRADAFDVIGLLEKTDFLEAYKGHNNWTMLRYIRVMHITSEEREKHKALAGALRDYASRLGKASDGADPTDIGQMRTRLGKFSRGAQEMHDKINSTLAHLSHEERNWRKEKLTESGDQFTADLKADLDDVVLENRIDGLAIMWADLAAGLHYRAPPKQDLSVGKVLGVIGSLAQKLAEPAKAPKPPKGTPGSPRGTTPRGTTGAPKFKQ